MAWLVLGLGLRADCGLEWRGGRWRNTIYIWCVCAFVADDRSKLIDYHYRINNLDYSHDYMAIYGS